MGFKFDRLEVERIYTKYHTSEILGQFIHPDARNPNIDYEHYPPLSLPIQDRLDWWRERGVERHQDSPYPWHYAIGYHVKPYLIAEIGTWWGYSVAAMARGAIQRNIDDGNLNAARNVTINGFDNEQYNPGCVAWLRECCNKFELPDIQMRGINHNVMVQDTQELEKLPLHMIELGHVDGDHTYDSALHDLKLMNGAMVPDMERGVILVDDVGWAGNLRAAVDVFCKEYGWDIAETLPALKSFCVLTKNDNWHA